MRNVRRSAERHSSCDKGLGFREAASIHQYDGQKIKCARMTRLRSENPSEQAFGIRELTRIQRRDGLLKYLISGGHGHDLQAFCPILPSVPCHSRAMLPRCMMKVSTPRIRNSSACDGVPMNHNMTGAAVPAISEATEE
jgi:hypothetical protein